MPNRAHTNTGTSLKERAARARQLTSEQQREAHSRPATSKLRRERQATASESDGSASSRSRRTRSSESRASKERGGSTGRTRSGGKKKETKRFAKRNAKSEHVEAPKRERRSFALPVAQLTTGAKAALGIVGVLVLCLVILYPVGQTYYQTMREEQRLQAVLDAQNARNAEIEKQNEELSTNEGVENQARTELGWTKEGESAAVVTNAHPEHDDSMTLPAQVDEESITAPHTWYYDVLDVVFFYSNN